MSVRAPVNGNDFVHEVERLVIRKSTPASVSCEARTPKGKNHTNGEATDQSNTSMTTPRKKGNSLGKGKMEIFQISADPEVAADKETYFNESFSFITPRNNRSDKGLLSTPRIDETLNESSNFDRASSKSDSNLEILEKLNALETSLAAMTATKERQIKREDELERLLRASNISQPLSSQLNLPEKGQTKNIQIVPQNSGLHYTAEQPTFPARHQQYFQSASSFPRHDLATVNMANNDLTHLINQSSLNTSFQGISQIGQQATKPYVFNKQMNNPKQLILDTGHSVQMQEPRQYPSTKISNMKPTSFHQNQNQVLPLQHQNLNCTLDSQTETQDLLYKVQHDMITRQREHFHSMGNLQGLGNHNSPSNSGHLEGHQTNPSTNQNLSYSGGQGNETVNKTQLNQSHVSFVENELSFCDFGNDSYIYKPSNLPLDSMVGNQSNLCIPHNQSFPGNFNQSDIQNVHRQENHCQNCKPQYGTIRNNDPVFNTLDFTKRDPTTNLTLIVNGTRLYIHKEVVSAWSNRWRHLVRVNSSAGDEITLRDTKLPTVQALLEYIYGVHKKVTDKNVYMLLELADKFEMPKIKMECERYLIEKNPDMKLLIVAQNFRLQQLYKKNLDFVTRQDLAVIERNTLFSQLNATTTASIYRTEIVRLRNSLRSHEQERLKWQHEIKKIEKKCKAEGKNYDQIHQLWQENRNRCHKHYTTQVSDFDFSCVDCNKKVHKRIQQICGESGKLTGTVIGDVSLLSDDVSD